MYSNKWRGGLLAEDMSVSICAALENRHFVPHRGGAKTRAWAIMAASNRECYHYATGADKFKNFDQVQL
jgi:hypothetical protein